MDSTPLVRLLESILLSAQDAIVVIDDRGHVVQCNPAASRMFGYGEDEMRGRDIHALILPDELRQPAEQGMAEFRRSGEGAVVGSTREVTARRRDGSPLPVELSVSSFIMDGRWHAVGIVRDVSLRKQEEAVREALRESTERFAHMADSVDGIVWEAQIDPLQFTYVSQHAERLLGYPVSRWLEDPEFWIELVHPEDREWVVSYCMAETREGRSHQMEYRMLARDGRVVWMRDLVTVVREPGSATRLCGVITDITLFKETEKSLREAEAKFRGLVEQSLVGVYIIQDGCFAYVNPRLAEIFGYTQGELMGTMPVLDTVAPEDRPRVLENLRLRLSGEVKSLNFEFRGLRRDGSLIDVEVFGTRASILGKPAVIGTLLEVTERRRLDAELRKNEELYRTLVDNLDMGVTLVDRDHRIVMANAYLGRLLDVDPATLIGRHCHQEYERRNQVCVHCPGTVALREEGPADVITQGVRKDGSRLWVRNRAVPFRSPDGSFDGFIEVVQDITQLREAEGAMMLSASVFDNSAEGIVITDADRRILMVNRAFTEITGYTRDEALGETPAVLKSNRHDRAFYAEMWRAIQENGRWQGEIWNRRKSGETYPEWLSVSSVKNAQGEVTYYIGIFSDLSGQKETQELIRRLESFDALTGLPNRALMHDRLAQVLTAAERHGATAGLVLLDLDRFRHINDTLGHDVGDRLLDEVAQRLKGAVRSGDTVARLAGDEFGIILGELAHPEDAALVAEKIRNAVARPVHMQGREFVLTCSMGIALYPEDGGDNETLSRNAEIAMYHAQTQGRNNYQFYRREMNQAVSDLLTLDHGMREGLRRGEFEIHYQPQVEIGSGRVTAVEALMRWHHPQQGMISPARFIPIAEETGLIVDLGRWMLRRACADAAGWRREGVGDLRVAVNLSARQFSDPSLVMLVEEALREAGLPAHYLELELTESIIMQRPEWAAEVLRGLRQRGIGVAIDDFGTGYSSLSYLKLFPLDRLKIDRSFVRDIHVDANDAAIVNAVVGLGHSLGLKVCAEGVETGEQLRFIAGVGCDSLQGYIMAKPMPAEELVRFLASSPRLPL